MAITLTESGITFTDGTTKSTTKDGAKAIFGFGTTTGPSTGSRSTTNLVSNIGVISTDTSTAATARYWLAAAGYGGDRAIFAYGISPGNTYQSRTSIFNNLGAYVSEVSSGVGTARGGSAGATYGGDKAVFAFGFNSVGSSLTAYALFSNLGVYVSESAGSGLVRYSLAAATYGGDKVIFGFGTFPTLSSTKRNSTLLVSNTGVYVAEKSGGTARDQLAAASIGDGKAIFGFGNNGTSYATSNTITIFSNLGDYVSETSSVGTGRGYLGGATYGGDKAIFGYGYQNIGATTFMNTISLFNNLGVYVSESSGVGTGRERLAASSFGP